MTSRITIGALLGTVALLPSLLGQAPAQAAPAVEASWEMNEPPGATTMVDSGPNGLHGAIQQTGAATDIQTGFTYNGATGYHWPRRSPTAAPASPERVIQVPDDPNLDARGDTFTVEIRYRTKENFGNITQKGQATTPGGQFKIQNPQGRPSCLYKGSIQRGGVRAPVALNDNQWHTLRCVKTPTAVELWVDGVRVGRNRGDVGWIDNNWPWTIGGKHRCDQIKVSCDYFSGQIDYVRVYRG